MSDTLDPSKAADLAHEAAMVAHDFFLVVSLALSTEGGELTSSSQEALWTVAQHGVHKAKDAREAIDRAGISIRTSRGRQ